jgi:hypothetical protein
MNLPFRLASAAIVLLVIGACASKTRMADMSLDELADSFRACAGPLGLTAKLPQLEAGGGSVLEGAFIKLSDPGIVSDGYYHWLTVDRKNSVVFIHESGGFAGRQRVYGPLTLPVACPSR